MSAINKSIAVAVVVSLCCLVSCKEFEIWNRLQGPIWIGAQANRGHSLPNGGGWHLEREARVKVNVPDNWAGRFWPRTWCNVSGDNTCETGGCGTNFECRGIRGAAPVSMAEFKLKGRGDLDYYGVSFVNGFNTMVNIIPLDTTPDDSENSCKIAACEKPFYATCPTELQKRNYIGVIGCHAACDVLKTDEYCCRGAYKKSNICNPTYWPINYPKFFKDECPNVKTHLYDNTNTVFSCKARSYLIVFNQ